MNTIRHTALAGLATLALALGSAAHAADAAAKATDKAASPAAKASEKAPKKARTPQQEKMAACSKEAKGKKGEERRAFMSGCLAAKPAAAASAGK